MIIRYLLIFYMPVLAWTASGQVPVDLFPEQKGALVYLLEVRTQHWLR